MVKVAELVARFPWWRFRLAAAVYLVSRPAVGERIAWALTRRVLGEITTAEVDAAPRGFEMRIHCRMDP